MHNKMMIGGKENKSNVTDKCITCMLLGHTRMFAAQKILQSLNKVDNPQNNPTEKKGN